MKTVQNGFFIIIICATLTSCRNKSTFATFETISYHYQTDTLSNKFTPKIDVYNKVDKNGDVFTVELIKDGNNIKFSYFKSTLDSEMFNKIVNELITKGSHQESTNDGFNHGVGFRRVRLGQNEPRPSYKIYNSNVNSNIFLDKIHYNLGKGLLEKIPENKELYKLIIDFQKQILKEDTTLFPLPPPPVDMTFPPPNDN